MNNTNDVELPIPYPAVRAGDFGDGDMYEEYMMTPGLKFSDATKKINYENDAAWGECEDISTEDANEDPEEFSPDFVSREDDYQWVRRQEIRRRDQVTPPSKEDLAEAYAQLDDLTLGGSDSYLSAREESDKRVCFEKYAKDSAELNYITHRYFKPQMPKRIQISVRVGKKQTRFAIGDVVLLRAGETPTEENIILLINKIIINSDGVVSYHCLTNLPENLRQPNDIYNCEQMLMIKRYFRYNMYRNTSNTSETDDATKTSKN